MRIAAINCSTNNLGDDIQALAAARHWNRQPDLWIDRDRLDELDPAEETAIIISGFIDGSHWPPSFTPKLKALVIGLHAAGGGMFSKKSLAWLDAHAPIGCRDLWTCQRLIESGIDAYLSGCPSLLLTQPPAPAAPEIVAVEVCEYPDAVYFNHEIPRDSPDRFNAALSRLALYAGAKLVVTTKLHCALPCLAFGVPCWFLVKNFQDPRFSGILDWLHVVSFDCLQGNQPLPILSPKRIHKPYARLMAEKLTTFVNSCELGINPTCSSSSSSFTSMQSRDLKTTIDFRHSPHALGDMIVAIKDATPETVFVLPLAARKFASLFLGKVAVIFSDSYPKKIEQPIWIDPERVEQVKTAFGDVSKSLALTINCSRAWKHVRETNPEKWQGLVDRFVQAGYRVFQYGTSENFTPLQNAFKFPDLDIADLASHYHLIGKYIGVDTGDMHLALAVGAKAWVARPNETSDYQYAVWEQKTPLAKYFHFNEMDSIYDSVVAG